MRVRQLTGPDDVRAILRVHARAWREAYSDILPEETIEQVIDPDPDTDHIDERFSTLWSDRDHVFLVESQGDVRGYAYFRWGSPTKSFVTGDEAGLKEIYVDPSWWGHGLGTELLDRGLDRIPDHITALKLEALAENDIGASFYAARGFTRTDTRELEIGAETYPTAIWTKPL